MIKNRSSRAACNFSNFNRYIGFYTMQPQTKRKTHCQIACAHTQLQIIKCGLGHVLFLYKCQTNSEITTTQSHKCLMRDGLFSGRSLAVLRVRVLFAYLSVSFHKVFGSFVDCLRYTKCNSVGVCSNPIWEKLSGVLCACVHLSKCFCCIIYAIRWVRFIFFFSAAVIAVVVQMTFPGGI